MTTLKVKRLHPDAVIPKYQTDGAACFDIHAVLIEETNMGRPGGSYEVMLAPDSPAIVPTGLAFEVPEGHVMLLFSRSGQGFRDNTRLANCVGVIDSDYRGELRVKLTKDSGAAIPVAHGERVAQAMILPVQRWAIQEVSELSDTERGEGGYGSTGK